MQAKLAAMTQDQHPFDLLLPQDSQGIKHFLFLLFALLYLLENSLLPQYETSRVAEVKLTVERVVSQVGKLLLTLRLQVIRVLQTQKSLVHCELVQAGVDYRDEG